MSNDKAPAPATVKKTPGYEPQQFASLESTSGLPPEAATTPDDLIPQQPPRPYTAFNNTGRTGSGENDMKRAGNPKFNALVTLDNTRKLTQAKVRQLTVNGGTTATIYEHESGSETEDHGIGHSAYHASVKSKKVTQLRGQDRKTSRTFDSL